MGKKLKLEVIKGNPHCQKVVEGGEYDGIGPVSARIKCDVETSMLHQDPGLGGQHRKRKCKVMDISGPPNPHPKHVRQPTEPASADPPCQSEQLKIKSRKSQSHLT